MGVGVRQESLPLVGIQLHRLLRAEAVPNATDRQRLSFGSIRPRKQCTQKWTYGLISLIMGFCTTLYPECTNGQAV